MKDLLEYICIYRFPEPRPTGDRWMTYASPLCSPARDRFVDVLSLCLPLLSRCSLVLSPAPSRFLLKRHSRGALGEYGGSMREYRGAASEHREAVYGRT